MTTFIYIKKYNEIINLEEIARISFSEPDEENDATLEIYFAVSDLDTLTFESDEAIELFAEIIKRIPNLVAI